MTPFAPSAAGLMTAIALTACSAETTRSIPNSMSGSGGSTAGSGGSAGGTGASGSSAGDGTGASGVSAGVSGGAGAGSGVGGQGSGGNDAAAMPDAPVLSDGGGGVSDGGRDLSTNRAAFLGPSRCASAGVQFCEDFESGMLDTATWTASATRPVVDALQAARGKYALHIVVNGNGISNISETKTFPAANNSYYGRAFFYFASLPLPAQGFAHYTMLGATGTGIRGEIRVSGMLKNQANLFGFGTDSMGDPKGTGDWTILDNDPPGMPKAIPVNQWVCIEWLHKGDTNETRFWWDGVEHPSIATTAMMHGGNASPFVLPQFNKLWIGWQEYQQTATKFESWIDEIAIDKDRIGCVL
jgi:hypothetical protein